MDIVLVGGGNMGFAMLKAWRETGRGVDLHLIEPNDDFRLRARALGANAYRAPEQLSDEIRPRLVVLAVKPQSLADVLPQYAGMITKGATCVSIVAGQSLETIRAGLGPQASIVRCMPNTPVAVGAGVIVCYADDTVRAIDRQIVDRLFTGLGHVFWIEDESLLHVTTALSGSGPAYVFHLIECLAAAAEKLGLPPELSTPLARHTVAGAGKLASLSEASPLELREQVTSPGGTTAAALDVLMTGGALQRLFEDTIRTAYDRSTQLGKT